jgi:YVTN family beta-propeller protein
MTNSGRFWSSLVLTLAAACGGGGGGGGSGGGTPVTAPQNLHYPLDRAIYTLETPIAPNTPTVDGVVATFTSVPALPAGLTLDQTTGAVVGTPAVNAPRTVYTITAENAGGSTQFDVTMTVVAPVRFAYAVSREDSTISIFSVDTASGVLQRKGYVLAEFEQHQPEKIVVHPDGRFAYVVNAGTNNISVYEIEPDSGWLHSRGAVPTGAGPHDIVIDPAGRFLYVTALGVDQIWIYSINQATGAIAPTIWPYPSGVQPSSLAIDPAGRFLFVTAYGWPDPPGTVSQFGYLSAVQTYFISPATGAIAPNGPPKLLNGTRPLSVAVDPYQDVIYVTLEAIDSVLPMTFHPVTGDLEYLSGDFAGDRPLTVSVHPSGRYAYVANETSGSVSCYRIDTQSGNLAVLDTVAAGNFPSCITIDPTGNFLYVANRYTNDLRRYLINPENGTITMVDAIETRNGPSSLAFAPGARPAIWTPRFVHVTNSATDDVSSYTVDPTTGALTETGLATLAGDRPVSIAVDPHVEYAYVANNLAETISTFAIDANSGALTEATAPTPVNGNPTHVMIEPSGRFLYAVAQNVNAPDDGFLTTYSIEPNTGSLQFVITQEIGPRPTWVSCDPTGRFLYCANSGAPSGGVSSISAFRITLALGIPQVSATVVTSGVFALGFHPSGRYAYATLQGTNSLVHYAINGADGALTLLPGVATSGLKPTAIAFNPDGRFCHVGYSGAGTGHVASFGIDQSGAPIVPPSTTTDGLGPLDLVAEASGRFVYVANTFSNDVSIMSIDPITGALTVAGSVATGLAPTSIVVSSETR